MPKNRYAQIRYEALDQCLSNRKARWDYDRLKTKVDLALERFDPTGKGISRSTFFEDIKWLESSDGYNKEIEKVKDGKKVYYRYATEGDSIHKPQLSEHEMQQLNEALKAINTIKGLPHFEWLEELNLRIQSNLTSNPEAIIHFEQNIFLTGIEHLATLYNSILYKEALCILYQSFNQKEPTEIFFHPWHLRQYNQRWFVFGFHPAQSELPFINLPLDRIKSIVTNQSPFIENTSVNFENWFEEIIGVTRPIDTIPEKIILKFSKTRAPYILTKPLHGSQKKLKEDESGVQISLEVIPNRELLQLIYSFGDDVTVIAPKDLAEKVRLTQSRSVNTYDQLVKPITEQ